MHQPATTGSLVAICNCCRCGGCPDRLPVSLGATADLLTASRYRGIGTGLAAAVKLTPLAFLIVLAVSRDAKSATRAAATFLVCTGLPWLLWPRMSGVFWFHDVSSPGRVGTVTYSANQCWYAILHRPPFPASGSEPAWLLLSLATLAIGTFIARRCVNAGQQAPPSSRWPWQACWPAPSPGLITGSGSCSFPR